MENKFNASQDMIKNINEYIANNSDIHLKDFSVNSKKLVKNIEWARKGYLENVARIDLKISRIKAKLIIPSFVILSIVIFLTTLSLILTPIMSKYFFENIETKITYITSNSVVDLVSIITIVYKLFEYVSSISDHQKDMLKNETHQKE